MLGYLQRGWIERSQKWGRDKTMFAPTYFGYNLEEEKTECLPGTQNMFSKNRHK